MKRIRNAVLGLCSLLVIQACSSASIRQSSAKNFPQRSIANAQDLRPLLQQVTLGYVMGHVLLKQFDACLHLAGTQNFWKGSFNNKHCSTARQSILRSQLYQQILTHRARMEALEVLINEIYLENINIIAHSEDSEERRLSQHLLNTLAMLFDETLAAQESAAGLADAPILYRFGLPRLQYKQEELKLLLEQRMAEESFAAGTVYADYIRQIDLRSRRYQNALNATDFESEEMQRALTGFVSGPEAKTIMAQIEQETIERLEQLRPQSSDRQPNSVAICAGADIDGHQLPETAWALTYEGGPRELQSQRVLDVLREANVKATYFLLARQVSLQPALAQAIKVDGMEIGVHSYDGRNIGQMVTNDLAKSISPQDFLDTQIDDAIETVDRALGIQTKLFRLPYGSGRPGVSNERSVATKAVNLIRQRLQERGMVHVFWNIDSLDWQDTNSERIARRVRAQVEQQLVRQHGGIILFHDVLPQTAEATRVVIADLQRQSKQLKTVGQLLHELNGDATCGQSH